MKSLTGKLIFSNQHDCFVNLPASLIKGPEFFKHDVTAFRIVSGRKKVIFLGWSGKCTKLESDDTDPEIEMDGAFAEVLQLNNHQQIALEIVTDRISPCHRLVLVPTDPSSWPEITKNAEFLEESLLQVIRVITLNLRFPMWLPSSPNEAIYFEITETEPREPCLLLSQDTVVEVAPFTSLKRSSSLPLIENPAPFLSATTPIPWSSFLWDMLKKSTSKEIPEDKRKDLADSQVEELSAVVDDKDEIEADLRVQELWDVDDNSGGKYSAIAFVNAFNHRLGAATVDTLVKASIRLIPVPETNTDSKSIASYEITLRLIGLQSNGLINSGHIGMTFRTMVKLDLRRFCMVKVSVRKTALENSETPSTNVELIFLNHPKFSKRKAAEIGFPEIIRDIVQYTSAALSLTNLMKFIHPCYSFMYSGYLVEGGFGSGKSSVLSEIIKELSRSPYLVHSEIIQCKYLRGRRPDSLRKLFEASLHEAIHKQPSLLIFDDVEFLAAHVTSDNDTEMDYAIRVAQILVDLVDQVQRTRNRVYFIASATSRYAVHEFLVNSARSSVFQNICTLPSLNLVKREKLLSFLVADDLLECRNMDFGSLALKTEGYVLRDLGLLAKRAKHHAVLRTADRNLVATTENIIIQEDFDHALTLFRPVVTESVITSGELAVTVGWSDVGGLALAKAALKDMFELPIKYPILYSKCPIKMPRGILLHGLPGTGKTFIAGVAAKEIGINLIHVRGPELLSKYIGASEAKVRSVFERAQAARPCLIFFDEFDAIAPKRGHDSTGVTDRVVNQLLAELDGVETIEGVYVLAATSRPELIDPAVLRPGRIDKCIHCPLPDSSERLEILSALCKNIPIDPDLDLTSLLDKTENFTGADLKAILTDAQLDAVEESMDYMSSNEGQQDDCVKVSVFTLTDDKPVEIDPLYKKQLIGEIKLLTRTPFNQMDEGNSKKTENPCIVKNKHLLAAFNGKVPSVSESERKRYESMVRRLDLYGISGLQDAEPFSGSMKVTLA